MTKKDVRDAYESVAPTPEQKGKMWNAILDAREQRPVQTTKLVRPGISRSRVRSAIAAVASLAAVLAVIVWIWPEAKSADTTAEMAEAQVADEAMPESAEEPALGMGTPEFAAAEDEEGSAASGGTSAYADVLEIYRTALEEEWTVQQCTEAGISSLAAAQTESDATTSDEGSAAELGYCLTDLDGDGTDELLISDGTVLYDLYAVHDGAAESIAQSTDFSSDNEITTCWLCEDSSIFIQSIGTRDTYTAYRVANGYLVAEQIIVCDYENYPDAPWRLGFNEEECTSEDADIAINVYKHAEISVTPFLQ